MYIFSVKSNHFFIMNFCFSKVLLGRAKKSKFLYCIMMVIRKRVKVNIDRLTFTAYNHYLDTIQY